MITNQTEIQQNIFANYIRIYGSFEARELCNYKYIFVFENNYKFDTLDNANDIVIPDNLKCFVKKFIFIPTYWYYLGGVDEKQLLRFITINNLCINNMKSPFTSFVNGDFNKSDLLKLKLLLPNHCLIKINDSLLSSYKKYQTK